MLVEVTQGRLINGGAGNSSLVKGVSTDSRQVAPESVFFALSGENFDGHEYVADAARAGAAAVVVSKNVDAGGIAVVQVEDTLVALGALAAWWRAEHQSVPVTVVVGSSGKTTTKEMAGEILARFKKTLSTRGNFNNLVGLPLTMFELQTSHEAAVLELGMNCPDENRKLMEIAQPDCVLLTNINHAHIGMFKSVRAHYEAEAEPVRYAPDDANLIINEDDLLSQQAYNEFGANRKVWKYSLDHPAEFYAKDIKPMLPFGYRFMLCSAQGQQAEVTLQMFGRHNVANAVGAAAIAAYHGISLEDAAEQLSLFRPRYNRSEIELLNGYLLVKDYYNAIPAAVISALRSLPDMEISGRKYAVLGDMLELGDHEVELHEQVAEAAAKAGLEKLFTVGDRGRIINAKATELGMNAQHYGSMEALADDVRTELKAGDLLFIKGSRALKLERLYDLLKNPVTTH